MSEEDYSVECETHGQRQVAYVCKHLVEGSSQGFNWADDPENPDGKCPDAWCNACEAALDQAGEWTDELVASSGLQVVCDLCYEVLRARNWIQDDTAFERLLSDATAFLNEQQTKLMNEYRLGDYERFDWNQETGQLVFSSQGRRRVIADIVFAGSVSTQSNTWLWSWANGSLLENVKARMREVRRYGNTRNFMKLAAAHWDATEEDGWEMTAIAAYLLGAAGVYRSPNERGFTFLVITGAAWAQ